MVRHVFVGMRRWEYSGNEVSMGMGEAVPTMAMGMREVVPTTGIEWEPSGVGGC